MATKTGVSASTVSRVLNNHNGIALATRRRVLDQARDAGLRPRGKSRPITIGVVVDRHQYATASAFVPNLLSHVIQALSHHDVAVELCTEHNLCRLNDRLIDGVLAMAWDDVTVQRLHQLGDVPVVLLNRVDVPEFSAVATDHRMDGQMAVEYLVGRGHRRIALICEEQHNWGSLERVEGFREQAQRSEIDLDSSLIAFTEHQPMYGLLQRVLASEPTAIFIANENLGLEASYILRDVLGVRVPDRVSLLGMESSQVSQFLSPPMTTLAQPLDQLAKASLDLLLRQIEEGDRTPSRLILRNQIIERESVITLPSATPEQTSPAADAARAPIVPSFPSTISGHLSL
ncbi:MAG TPA: LacI family DNA-binding transcriptional regulator [Tepidisphaeraceae bacterium]|nr:LacI family DNA-binding transcriptional regulator [Tepidisphaeraceae bacterium]